MVSCKNEYSFEFFDNKLATNLNTFDPYGIDDNKTRINVLNIKNGGGLLHEVQI